MPLMAKATIYKGSLVVTQTLKPCVWNLECRGFRHDPQRPFARDVLEISEQGR